MAASYVADGAADVVLATWREPMAEWAWVASGEEVRCF